MKQQQRMKPLWMLLTVASLLLPFSAQAQATLLSGKTESCRQAEQAYTPIQQRYERGLIFRVEKCGYSSSYIMGTMHSDSAKIAPVFTDAMAIIPALKAVGFEFVEDERTAMVAQQYMMLPSTSPEGLSSMITAEEFDLLANTLQRRMNMPRQAVDRMRPWAAAVTLQYPAPTSDGISLDKRLQQRAKALNKKLFGLETPAEQFQIFHAVPRDKQLVMLRDTLRNIESVDENNDEFMQAYVTRDLITLHRLADESFAMTSDHELRVYLEEEMLHKRNRNMVSRMDTALRSGNVMVAVGALHLMGSDGILPLLEKDGWRIKVVR